MRRQDIVRVVDMLGGPQDRIVLWLRCNHKVSIDRRAITSDPNLQRELKSGRTHWDCPFCADAPPEDVRQGKSATQLWKEAGEP